MFLVKDFLELMKEKILEWINFVKMIYVLPRNYIKSHFRRLYEWGLSLKEPLKGGTDKIQGIFSPHFFIERFQAGDTV